VFAPLTWISLGDARLLVTISSLAAALGAVLLVLRDRGMPLGPKSAALALGWTSLAIIFIEPVRSCLLFGQIELVLMFVVTADLLIVPRRYRGLATGAVAAIKLTPLVFVIVLIVRRELRSAARAALTFLVLEALDWLLWPTMSHTFWLHDLTDAERVGSIKYVGNQSWLGVLHRLPLPSSLAHVLWILVSLVTLGLGAFVAWRRAHEGQRAQTVIVIALAGLLISPISWTHHWVWVMLIPPLLLGRPRSTIPRLVQVQLWGLVALTVLQPYWWSKSGDLSVAFSAVMPIWTFLLLLVWSAIELERMREAEHSGAPRRLVHRGMQGSPTG
jgi:alpha-1,2-mannosyltransferase